MTWLGNRSNQWERFQFPEGTLNEAQIRTLFEIEDAGRRVVELDLKPAIFKLTDDGIVEVHVRFGGRRSHMAQRAVFWMNEKGKHIVACEEFWDQPGRPVKAYLKRPDDAPYAKAEERDYPDGLWTLGNFGAIAEIRDFIRENWTGAMFEQPESIHDDIVPGVSHGNPHGN